MDLQADSIQGVLFVLPNAPQDDALRVWGRVFPNDSPDGFQKNTSTPALNSSAHGLRGGFLTTVSVQVGRIDVTVMQEPPSGPAGVGPPRIADVLAGAELVRDLLKRAAEGVHAIRVAFVLDLAKTVAAGTESVEILKLAPRVPLPDKVTDVVIQFNLRKKFTFNSNLEMNRLCNISSGQAGFIMQPRGMNGFTPMMMVPFVGFKIDVNSAPESIIEMGAANSAIDEISKEALEINEQGIARFQDD